MSESNEHIIGIDLGTTNSVVAVLEGDKPQVIVNAEGMNRTPSVVGFLPNGEVVVGELARRQAATNAANTISAIKRMMGRFYSDLEEQDLNRPFKIIENDNQILIEAAGRGYTPPQIASLVLAKLKKTAEDYLGAQVTKAVITVPAYFDDLQREATAEAGRLAGLEVLRLLNEPTAAAMAYGLGRDEQETIAVYDFGGGTFDISILDVDRNSFEVLTSNGDTQLGGEDMDRLLLMKIAGEFQEKHGIDLTQDAMTHSRLKEAVEKAKCELSTVTRARLSLPFIAYKGQQPLHLERDIERGEFEEMIEPLVERTVQICKRALNDAGLKRTSISKVIMVGGASRIPLVQDMVAEFFDQDPFKGVNPDEVVAMGAATQAAVFGGKLEEVVLMDVTPFSLGIEVLGGRFCPVIEKNTTIPIKAGKVFTTTEDNQEYVVVHVLQGESENTAENRSLGRFTLSGLKPRPKGSPRIQVVFFINSDGIVEISAKDLESGIEKGLSVVHSHLGKEEEGERRRQRATSSRRRRRRAEPDRIRPEFEGVQLRDAQDAPATPAQAASFQEVVTADSPISPSSTGATTARARVGATTPASRATPVATSPAAAEPVTAAAPRDPSKTAQAGAAAPLPPAPSSAAPGAMPSPATGLDLPESIRMAEAMLAAGKGDTPALLLYDRAIADYQSLIAAQTHPAGAVDWAIVSLARIHALKRQPDEAMTLLRDSRRDGRLPDASMRAALDDLLERFPNYGPALIERAGLRADAHDLPGAIADAERAVTHGDGSEDWLDRLELYYQRAIREDPDASLEFKLVKIYLRKDKVDEAIDVLQRLVENPATETRALKILGLCFWQKNLYYLAWQKFRQMELDEELKDILYRLAADMEAADQLSNARQVLDHLVTADAAYRDAQARLQRLTYQLKAQQDGLERAGTPGAMQILKDSRFIILEEINRGSMGVIYRARDVVLDEVVALKVLNEYLTADPMAVERFKKEARAARKLTHPNIVRIHDFFESGNKKFISMEYIEGKDFKTILHEEQSLPPARVAEICSVIAKALDYAHSRRVIHRDIKPANLMQSSTGEIRITDFGIAKLMRADDATLGSSVVMGTPLYMAPEQIEGGEIDARADLYALGIVMYEMVAGRPPFCDGNIEYHHINTLPPPLPASTPSELSDIIQRCIRKKAEERFQSAAELAQALRGFLKTCV